MKFLHYSLIALSVAFATSCTKDPIEATPNASKTGSFDVEFENKVGRQPLVLRTSEDSTAFDYTTAKGEKYNLTTFGYYVSAFTLTGPNGESYSQTLEANALESKGYYHVVEGQSGSNFFSLNDVPEGTYDRISFTLGIGSDGVMAGASGGVLDPAKGAWMWNWNAGYVAMKIEGFSDSSPQAHAVSPRFTKREGSFFLHVGGWKDVPGNENFTNNLKTISLDFGTPMEVRANLNAPLVHIITDVAKVLDANHTFTQDFSVHSPKAGASLANSAQLAFSVDHVHQ